MKWCRLEDCTVLGALYKDVILVASLIVGCRVCLLDNTVLVAIAYLPHWPLHALISSLSLVLEVEKGDAMADVHLVTRVTCGARVPQAWSEPNSLPRA